MATMGAAICMSQGMDGDWTKVIYVAAVATALCNLAIQQKGGADEHVPCKHGDILPQTHTKRPRLRFIILNKNQLQVNAQT